MSRFRFGPGGRRPHEPWFSIGTLEVGTTWFVVLFSIVAILVAAITGFSSTFEWGLGLDPVQTVHHYRWWSVVTWPFAYWGLGLTDVIALFFFWYFGAELERDLLGRTRFAWMLVVWTVILGGVMVGIYAIGNTGYPLTGMPLLEMMLILVWVAEWPRRMFLFNIPAWVVGLVIVALQVIGYLGQRNWTMLIDFVVGAVLCGFAARQFGLLSDYAWIPKVVGNRPRRRRLRSVPAQAAQPVPPRPVVTPGPWTPPVAQADEDRMNELLEKIHDHGTESLSERERAELNELRLRRRGSR